MSNTDRLVEPITCLQAENVALGPLRHDLLPLYQRWDNDAALLVLEEAYAVPTTFESIERRYQDLVAKGKADTIVFTIYERSTWRPIGRTALHTVDHVQRTADFSIGIAERDCWGRGYGTETCRLMLDYGFTLLGLHNIMLAVFSFNTRPPHLPENRIQGNRQEARGRMGRRRRL